MIWSPGLTAQPALESRVSFGERLRMVGEANKDRWAAAAKQKGAQGAFLGSSVRSLKCGGFDQCGGTGVANDGFGFGVDEYPAPQYPRAQSLWRGNVTWRSANSYDAVMAIAGGLAVNPTREGLRSALAGNTFTAHSLCSQRRLGPCYGSPGWLPVPKRTPVLILSPSVRVSLFSGEQC
ncbi:MAG: hypothetical protein SNJ60_05300 [Pseudanabaenaceae cyanobacterium]